MSVMQINIVSVGGVSFKVYNADSQALSQLSESIAYLESSSIAYDVLRQMQLNGVSVFTNNVFVDEYNPKNSLDTKYPPNTVVWGPRDGLSVLANVGSRVANGGIVGIESSAVGFIHEGGHSTDKNLASNSSPTSKILQYGNMAEFYAVGVENSVGQQLGETSRYNHGGLNISEVDPTEHTVQNANGSYSWQDNIFNNQVVITGGSFTPGRIPALPAETSFDRYTPIPDLAVTPNSSTQGSRIKPR